jgi:hypothetical protein
VVSRESGRGRGEDAATATFTVLPEQYSSKIELSPVRESQRRRLWL